MPPKPFTEPVLLAPAYQRGPTLLGQQAREAAREAMHAEARAYRIAVEALPAEPVRR